MVFTIKTFKSIILSYKPQSLNRIFNFVGKISLSYTNRTVLFIIVELWCQGLRIQVQRFQIYRSLVYRGLIIFMNLLEVLDTHLYSFFFFCGLEYYSFDIEIISPEIDFQYINPRKEINCNRIIKSKNRISFQ